MIEPVAISSRTISDEARRLAKDTPGLTGKQAQEMLDTLNGFGLAEPMWPHFKSMGFRESEAGLLREGLKQFDRSRRTSLPGVERLQPRAIAADKLAAVVAALTAGKPADLSALDPKQANLLRRAGDDVKVRAAALLENELAHFFTDSPVDLVDGHTDAVKRGLSAAIRAETARLAGADDATLRRMRHEGFSSIGLLRELAVLDPREAQKLGTAFAAALHAQTGG